MSEPEFRATEFPVASEVYMSIDVRPTPEAVAVVPEIPASERVEDVEIGGEVGSWLPPLPTVDERVEGLLAELLTQLKERKALEDVAAARWTRCTELLEEVRLVRRLLRGLLGETRSPGALIDLIEATKESSGDAYSRYNETMTELVEWLAKPI